MSVLESVYASESKYLIEQCSVQWLEESDPQNNIVHYIVFRAADHFAKQHSNRDGKAAVCSVKANRRFKLTFEWVTKERFVMKMKPSR